MDYKKLILVTGIHGVGKTTICKRLSSLSGYQYLSASTLIFNYLQTPPPKSKQVTGLNNLCHNQEVLVQALSTQNYERILLEGHLCLVDEDLIIREIPDVYLNRINLSAIVLLTRSVDNIYHDLLKRGQTQYTQTFLDKLQDEEKILFNSVVKKFNLPSLRIDLSVTEIPLAVTRLNNFLKYVDTL